MLNVDVHYADLELPIRKGLVSRQALLTLKDAAWAARHPRAALFAREVTGKLETLTVPIASPDSERLDTFLAGQVLAVLPVLATPLPAIRVCCTTCSGRHSLACDGIHDVRYVEPSGHCVLPIKECCDLAVRAMHSLYALLAQTGTQHVHVSFQVAAMCPRNAVHCVSGSSSYADHDTDQTTNVTIDIGLRHWELESYAAVALILAHELVCHVGHGLRRNKARGSTSPDDRYVEGWMDFVARNALLEELERSWRQLDPASPLRARSPTTVAGIIAGWRTTDTWSGSGSCQDKRYDSAAPHRRYGEQQAREARHMFEQLGAAAAFFEFSAKFNAADTTKRERDALLDEVDVVSGMIGAETHRLTRALERFAVTRDIEEFRQILAS